MDETARPEVTVVVPVFDAMPYLVTCLSSLMEQSIGRDRLEVVAVDDGSTDGSGTQLDLLAASWPNLHVVHQAASGGPSRPRNTGLDRANVAASAAATVSTPTISTPAVRGNDVGPTTRVNPRRAASATRRAACATPRTSPPSPTSPITTVRPSITRSSTMPATAASTARSIPVSATRTPPATLAYTSARRVSMAA